MGRDLRLRRHGPDGRRARVLSRCRSAGLHPVRAQHRDARADAPADRRAALVRRPRRGAGADRPGRRPGRAAEAAALAQGAAGPRAGRALCAQSARPASKRRGSIRGCSRSTSRRSAATSTACRCSTSPFPAHAVIGDRAYAEQPEAVAALGRAAAEGLMAEGVMPVIKHIPGHGRAHGRFAPRRCRPVSRAARHAGAHRLPAVQAAEPTCRGR